MDVVEGNEEVGFGKQGSLLWVSRTPADLALFLHLLGKDAGDDTCGDDGEKG